MSRARLTIVGLAVFVTHAYFIGAFSWNQHARLGPVLTFVEPGPGRLTFRIEDFVRRNPRGVETHDWALGVDGYLYSNKAPGSSMLAVPAYAALWAAESAAGLDVRSYEWTRRNAIVLTWWTGGLWTAAAATVFLAFLVAWGWSPRDALVPVLAYALGSLVLPFDTSLWGHTASAACVLISLCLAFWPAGTRHSALAGVFGGLAVLCDYPAVFGLAAIGLAMIARASTRRRSLVFAAGAALPLIVLAAYQKVVFGGFLTPTVVHGNPSFLTAGHAFGVLGAVSPGVVWMLLFSLFRGLFVYCPVLLFSAAGGWQAWKRGDRVLVIACAGAFGATVIFVSSFNGWWGGACTGPRYLIAAIPWVAVLLPAASALGRTWRVVYVGSLVVSIANMVAIAAVDVMVSDTITNPLFGSTYPLLWSGQYPHNRVSGNGGADLLGLPPTADLLPFLVIVGLLVATIWRPTRRSSHLDRLAAIVQCPECQGACTRAADGNGLLCAESHGPYRMRDGVLIVELAGERPEVAAERAGVRATERNATLGGINDAFDDLAHAEGALKEAILALPDGDGSRYYGEPGYFLNVKNSLRGFRFVTHRLRRRPGQRLLDVGADLTWSTNHFAREGLRCTAIDVNDHLGVGELFQARYHRPYDMVRVDMHAEVFRSGAFDLVVAINALHHSGDIVRVAGNLSRVLSPGGRLAAVEPYCIDLSQKADFGREQIEAGINENTYLLDEWHAAFTGAGLVLEELMLSDSCNMIYRKPEPGERVAALTTMLERAHAGRLTAQPLAGGAGRRWTDGHALAVPVEITNLSNATWCSDGRAPIFVSYHLSRGDARTDTMVAFDNRRSAIPDIPPGVTVVCEVLVDAPQPAGMYTVTFDLVQEGICWFAQRGFKTDAISCDW